MRTRRWKEDENEEGEEDEKVEMVNWVGRICLTVRRANAHQRGQDNAMPTTL
jgi:hypothetical protein